MAASTRFKFSTFFMVFAFVIIALETWNFIQTDSSTSSKLKYVYLIIHGQAIHNVSPHCNDRDPKLTELGSQQAKNIKITESPDLILISPLTRTIQTADYAFPNLRHLFMLHVDIQESNAGNLPCDTGREKELLKQEFLHLPSNLFDNLPTEWYNPTQTFQQRLATFQFWLAGRNEQVIFVVAHHGVFREWLGLDLKNGEVAKLIINGEDIQIITQ